MDKEQEAIKKATFTSDLNNYMSLNIYNTSHEEIERIRKCTKN